MRSLALLRHAIAALAAHWWRNPVQLAALFAGLAIATALWSGVQALNAEARASYDRAAGAFDAGIESLVPARGGTVPDTAFAELRRAGWDVSPILEATVESGGERFRLIGIEALTLSPRASDRLTAGAEIGEDDDGAFLDFVLPPHRTYASAETLADLGAAPGEAPQLAGGQALPPLELRRGIAPGLLVVDIGAAQRLVGAPGEVSRLLIGTRGAGLPLAEATEAPLRRIAAAEEGDLERLTESFHLNLTAFGLLAFLVGLFIVHSAIGLAFEQRRATFRTLRAIGVPAGTLAWALCLELLGIALVAGAVGLVGGYLLAGALLPDVAASLGGLYGAEVPGELGLRPSWWLAGLAMCAGGALAAAAQSLWRAWSMPVLASAQPQAWAEAQRRWLARQGLAAMGAVALAIGLVVLGDGLTTGFAALAAVIVAAALALPVLLGAVLRAAEARSRAPMLRWFWADARQQLSGLSLALMALLLALGVNIGVGSMVGSFRTTFTGWLDGRLAAEIYLRAETPRGAQEIRDWLGTRGEVDAVLPTADADSRMGGWPVEVVGFVDHATYRELWPLLDAAPDAWDRIARGSGAMLSEQMSLRLDADLGDTVEVATPAGPWAIEVVAIHPDYGNPRGQLRVGLDAFAARFPDDPPLSMGVRVAPEDAGSLAEALRTRFGLDPDRLREQAGLKEVSHKIFERTFAVTAALNTLTLAVAGVALLTALVTLSGLRLPQIAPVWAIGVEQARLGWIEFWKMLMLAGLTVLAAIPLGLAIAWLLLNVINVEAFGWRLPMHLFPGQWLTLGVLALVTAALASAWPIWQIARMAPVRLVHVFAAGR